MNAVDIAVMAGRAESRKKKSVDEKNVGGCDEASHGNLAVEAKVTRDSERVTEEQFSRLNVMHLKSIQSHKGLASTFPWSKSKLGRSLRLSNLCHTMTVIVHLAITPSISASLNSVSFS